MGVLYNFSVNIWVSYIFLIYIMQYIDDVSDEQIRAVFKQAAMVL